MVAGGRLTDWISLGVLASWVPADAIDDAVAVTGKTVQRRGGKLPPRVVAYLVMALALAGRHNVRNALAAAAAATSAGATLADVAAGLGSMRAVKGRLQLRRTRAGAWLIDDSYNANPSSARAGLEVLSELPGRRWLVLGDMAELGEFADSSHRELGELARALGVERLYAFGALAGLAADSFGDGAERYRDATELTRALDAAITPDVRLLIKGSRVNRLERVVDALVPAAAPQALAQASGR